MVFGLIKCDETAAQQSSLVNRHRTRPSDTLAQRRQTQRICIGQGALSDPVLISAEDHGAPDEASQHVRRMEQAEIRWV